MSPDDKMMTVVDAIGDTGKRVAKHIADYGQHEYHTYKGAATAVSHLASGKSWSKLDPKHKKALRNAMIHAGITASSMALGDATGGAAHNAIAHLIGSFAAEHAHHAVLLGGAETVYKSGKDLVKKVTASGNDELRKAHRTAEILLKADIPIAELIHILREIERRRKLAEKLK
jgi:hypothetical protein